MYSFPRVTGKDVVRAFEYLGFSVACIEESHHILKKPGHPLLLSIPVHGNEIVKKGLLSSQIKKAGVSLEDFISALRH